MICKTLIKPILFSLLMFGIMVGGNLSAEDQSKVNLDNSQPFDGESFKTDMDNYLKLVRILLEEIPQHQFDTKALVKRIGKDAQELSNWVSNNINWVAYEGILKGPNGTLMAQKGNSWDRSILLHTLLNEAGHTSRLAWGNTTKDAKNKLNKMAIKVLKEKQVKPHGQWIDFNKLESKFELAGFDKKLVTELQQASKQENNVVKEQYEKDATDIYNGLKDIYHQVTESVEGDLNKRIQSSIEQFVWVEVLDKDEWKSIGGAFAGGINYDYVSMVEKVNTGTIKDIPKELFHSVELEIVANVTKSGQSTKGVLLNHVFITQEVNNNRFKLNFVSPNSGKTKLSDLKEGDISLYLEGLDDLRATILNLGSGSQVAGAAINSSGEVIESYDAISNYVRKRDEQLNNASDLLGGLGSTVKSKKNESAQIEVVAFWTINKPSGEKNKIRRLLLSGNTLDEEFVQKFKAKLSRSIEGYIQVGRVPESYFYYEYFSAMSKLSLPIRYLTKKIGDVSSKASDFEDAFSKMRSRLKIISWHALLWARSRELNNNEFYLMAPSVMAYNHFFNYSKKETKVVEVLDIIVNSIESRLNDNAKPEYALAAIKDTVLEGYLLKPSGSSQSILDIDWSKTDSLFIVNSSELKSMATFNQTVINHFSTFIENGDVIIASKDSSKYWWRVNPNNGQVVGEQYQYGEIFGTSFTEYVTKLKNSWEITKVLIAFMKCGGKAIDTSNDTGDRTTPVMACLVCAVIKTGKVMSKSTGDEALELGFDLIANICSDASSLL